MILGFFTLLRQQKSTSNIVNNSYSIKARPVQFSNYMILGGLSRNAGILVVIAQIPGRTIL